MMEYKIENGWKKIENLTEIFKFSEGYKKFLDLGKTEREFVNEGIKYIVVY